MPTYEYACKSCGAHLEVVQSFKDDPLTTCPSCQGVLRKVFGNIGIAFKGSGFYRNDSREAAKASSKSKTGSGSASAQSSSDSAGPSTPGESAGSNGSGGSGGSSDSSGAGRAPSASNGSSGSSSSERGSSTGKTAVAS